MEKLNIQTKIFYVYICNQEKRKKKEKEREEEALDPMDPAAYSEVPRGTWTTGSVDTDKADNARFTSLRDV